MFDQNFFETVLDGALDEQQNIEMPDDDDDEDFANFNSPQARTDENFFNVPFENMTSNQETPTGNRQQSYGMDDHDAASDDGGGDDFMNTLNSHLENVLGEDKDEDNESSVEHEDSTESFRDEEDPSQNSSEYTPQEDEDDSEVSQPKEDDSEYSQADSPEESSQEEDPALDESSHEHYEDEEPESSHEQYEEQPDSTDGSNTDGSDTESNDAYDTDSIDSEAEEWKDDDTRSQEEAIETEKNNPEKDSNEIDSEGSSDSEEDIDLTDFDEEANEPKFVDEYNSEQAPRMVDQSAETDSSLTFIAALFFFVLGAVIGFFLVYSVGARMRDKGKGPFSTQESPSAPASPTLAPTFAPSSRQPSTNIPSVAPSTALPSVRPSTLNPTSLPTTLEPTVSPSTSQPTTLPTPILLTEAPTSEKSIENGPSSNQTVLVFSCREESNSIVEFAFTSDEIDFELIDDAIDTPVWSFRNDASGKLRQNVFATCVPPDTSYTLVIQDPEGDGLVSDILGEPNYGSFRISQNGATLTEYSSLCAENVTGDGLTECGAFCYCSTRIFSDLESPTACTDTCNEDGSPVGIGNTTFLPNIPTPTNDTDIAYSLIFSCEDLEEEQYLLDFRLVTDTKPTELAIELTDDLTGQRIWSFTPAMMSELGKRMVLSVCLSVDASYTLMVRDTGEDGLISSLEADAYGYFSIQYEGELLEIYHGDCNTTDINVTFCGAFCECVYSLDGTLGSSGGCSLVCGGI